MKILFETDKYKLSYDHENAYIVHKDLDQELFLDDFYGDPECGLIDENNKWIIVAGDHLTVYRPLENKIVKFENINLKWITEIKLIKGNIVHLLIDPWSENSAIWELDCDELKCKKIKDFNKYKGKPYVEKVIW